MSDIQKEVKEFNINMYDINDVVIMIDIAGKITLWNEMAKHLMGYSEEEMIGKTLECILVPGTDACEGCMKLFRDLEILNINNIFSKPHDSVVKRKDGKIVEVTISCSLVNIKGDFGIVLLLHDISQYKQKLYEAENTEKKYFDFMENAPIGITCCDKDGNITYINSKTLEILGSNSLEETKRINLTTFPLLVNHGFSEKLIDCMEHNKSGMYEMNYQSKWGKIVSLRLHVQPSLEREEVVGAQIILDDITEKVQLELEKRYKQERLQLMLKGIPSPAWLISKDLIILDQNKSAELLFEKKIGDFVGNDSTMDNKNKLLNVELISHNTETVNQETIYEDKVWSIWWIPLGEDIFLYYANDITKYKEIEENLMHLSNTDSLTGLKNRLFFDQAIKNEIERSNRFNQPFSTIMLDLDHFKRVNDTYGHPIGDEVLKQTAEILKKSIRKSDILARMGGEEFMIILTQTDSVTAFDIAENIRKTLEVSYHPIAGKVTASFGVAERNKGESAEDIYKHVDEALYLAKAGGRNRVVSYESMTNAQPFMAFAHLEWSSDLECSNIVIDEQHKQLFNIGNSLIFMSFSKVNNEKIGEQLSKLLNHIADHFAYEEKVLLDAGYPDYMKHIQLHQQLLEKAVKIKKIYEDGMLKPSEIFSFLLDNVVVGHLMEDDTKYFSYLRSRNK